MSRDILERMADAAVVALCADGGDWPRGLVSATLIPDAWMGLVERRDGRRRFVPAGEDPKSERGERLLLVRNRPLTVPISVNAAPASCGHAVGGECEVLVRWQPRDDDLAALRNTLLDKGELSLDGLATALSDAGGRTVLQQFIRQHPATELVHDDLRDELFTALREQLKRFLFSSGLTLERVATMKLLSESLARHEALERETAARVERIQARKMVEQAALTATNRRLDELGDVLEKLKAASAGDEHMQWHDLLPALAPAERGRLLENLWRLTPDRSRAAAIVVVAGRQCVWLDPSNPERIQRRVSLSEDLGGLRSATFDSTQRALLIGAARGVWIVGSDDGQVRGQYEVPGTERPRTGFNAVTITGQRLCGTHSQLGVWCWMLDAPDQAEALFKPIEGQPKTIRAATATADGRLLFAGDDTVHLLSPDGTESELLPPAAGVIQCLAVEGGIIYAGTTDGSLVQLNLDRPEDWIVVHRGTAAFESVFPRRWSDLVELVIPVGAAGISGVYGQEGIVARLMQTPVPVRRAWACDDLLVGLSDYRDRLLVMNSDAPTRMGREVPVGRMLGHSVQDACIVVRDAETERQRDEGDAT